MDLLQIRDQLDQIDREIVRLYQQRMALCEEVARYKIETGKAVLDPERERQKLEAVAGMVSTSFDKKAIRELYQQMMTVSRRLQLGILAEHGKRYESDFVMCEEIPRANKRVVYQGVAGAYAHIAASSYFGEAAEIYSVRSWRDAMEAVKQGEADYAVLPIENSSAGAVSDNFDLLLAYENAIVAEVDIRVDHALMGLEGCSIEALEAVYSHGQALAQCSDFFAAHPEIEKVTVDNTAVAAKLVAESGNRRIAALASEQSAALYGLQVIQSSVNQQKTNTTRFIVVGSKREYSRSAGKISICFEAAHKSGSLYNVLGNFIFNDVNMIMIQSRPVPERNWEYRFFVDIEGRLDDSNIVNAFSGMQDEVCMFRVLGCY